MLGPAGCGGPQRIACVVQDTPKASESPLASLCFQACYQVRRPAWPKRGLRVRGASLIADSGMPWRRPPKLQICWPYSWEDIATSRFCTRIAQGRGLAVEAGQASNSKSIGVLFRRRVRMSCLTTVLHSSHFFWESVLKPVTTWKIQRDAQREPPSVTST